MRAAPAQAPHTETLLQGDERPSEEPTTALIIRRTCGPARPLNWHPEQMSNELDPARARGALAVIKQHPGMVLFLATPALLVVGAVWVLAGAGWAALAFIALVLGGGGLLYRGLKQR